MLKKVIKTLKLLKERHTGLLLPLKIKKCMLLTFLTIIATIVEMR